MYRFYPYCVAMVALGTLLLVSKRVLIWAGVPEQEALAIMKTGFLVWLVLSIGGILALFTWGVVTSARRTDAAGINANAAPERKFGYPGYRTSAVMVGVLGIGLAAPLLYWSYLLVFEPDAAEGWAWPCAGGAAFLLGVLLCVVARRGWKACVTIYHDRLDVSGVYSIGSMKWAEAVAFTHEEISTGSTVRIWAYFLSNGDRKIRVDAAVHDPDEFVRIVKAKTGLRLEELPLGK